MRIGTNAWQLVIASCVAMVACGAPTTDSGNAGSSSGGGHHSGSSSGDGNFGDDGGSGSSSGDGTLSSGDSSGSGSGSVTGDDGGSGSSGGDDASSGTSSGSSGSGSGGMGCNGFAGYVRGPDPTAASAAKAGPYQTMSYAANASVRSTKAYDVTSAHIFYPVGATPPFTAISIVPGFTAAESSIEDWGPFLASYGIVAMTFGTSNPATGAPDTSVQPPVRGDALIDALTTIKGENTRSGSPLVGKLDLNRLAIAGWSMGGGGTLIAASAHPELKACFSMEPWNSNYAANPYASDTVPSLIFAGTNDGLVGSAMWQGEYMSIPATTPKLAYEFQGGTHWVSTSPTNAASDMEPAGSNSTASVATFGISWLKVFLECDLRYKQFLTVSKPSNAAEFDSTVK
jgi:dienelactone hydrolase